MSTDSSGLATAVVGVFENYSVDVSDVVSLAAGTGIAAVLILVVCGIWHRLHCRWQCCIASAPPDLESRGALLDESVPRSDRSHDARDPFKASSIVAKERQDPAPAAVAASNGRPWHPPAQSRAVGCCRPARDRWRRSQRCVELHFKK